VDEKTNCTANINLFLDILVLISMNDHLLLIINNQILRNVRE